MQDSIDERITDAPIHKEQTTNSTAKPYTELGISAAIHITLFDDHTLSFKTNGECCDLAATLATVMLERPEFNEIYDNAQKVIVQYLTDNN